MRIGNLPNYMSMLSLPGIINNLNLYYGFKYQNYDYHDPNRQPLPDVCYFNQLQE